MYKGFYTAASGILTRQREIDIIGNNLANINTAGYKAETTIIGAFEQELSLRIDENGETVIGGAQATSAIVDSVEMNDESGMIQNTGRTLDIAIEGPGFYVVDTGDGEQYLTREGSFVLDDEGYLSLENKGRVQNQDGDIFIGQTQFTVLQNGDIIDTEGEVFAGIGLAVMDENSRLEKNANSLLEVIEGGFTFNNDSSNLYQGSLELSNVDMNEEMTDLIRAQRAYEACSSALQIIDDINQRAVSIASI